MMRILVVAVFLVILSTSVMSAAECETSLLPAPGENGGVDVCTYTHVAHDTFSYTNNIVQATWSSEYEVIRAGIVKEWKWETDYSPGLQVRVVRDPAASRYDFLLQLKNVATQEVFVAITPVWCNDGGTWIDAPPEGCWESQSGCSTTDETTCADGTVLSLTCEGDTGTCSSCGVDGHSVCCKATKKTTTQGPAGEQITITALTEKEQHCPGEGE